METEQSEKWVGNFGKGYLERNPKNIQEFDELYMKNFGITKTSLNNEFLIDLPKDMEILEVGSNVGAQLTGLQEIGFKNLTGIEIFGDAVEYAKQNTKGIDFLKASALDLPFKNNHFDLVFTAGVLIHIHPDDLNKVIDEMYRTSKKYIWGFEYFAETCQEIGYRGNENMLWKNNFMKLFLERYPNLKIVKEKKVNYLGDNNVDHMFLLEKTNSNQEFDNINIKHCKKCAMPETRPGSIFDEKGVCQACNNHEKRKSINWDKRKEKLRKICDKYRKDDGSYDCVIPVSGGKDSHRLVYIIKEEMKMNPLLITLGDSFTTTEAGKKNYKNIGETFNCDHLLFELSEEFFRKIVRLETEEYGEPLRFIEIGLYTIPTKLAIKMGIPLIIYGEDSAYEYGTADKETEAGLDGVLNMYSRVDMDFLLKNNISKKELNVVMPPTQEELERVKPELIFMSHFVPWSSTDNLEIAKRYGFVDLANEWDREGCIENFEQIDSMGYLVHLWMKYPKFGFQRVSDIASRRVREGKLSLDEAKKLILEKDSKLDPKALADFLRATKYTKKEFWEIIEKYWNKDIFEKIDGIWRLKKSS